MGDKWSVEEIEIVNKYYSTSTKEKLMILLPKRSWSSIRHIASDKNLKLLRPKPTEATKRKMHESHMGLKPTPETIKKLSENNPMKKPENANKISLIRKEYWRTHPEVRQSYSDRMSGSNNKHWQGGIKPRPKLGSSYWRKIRQTILERDSYHCLFCNNDKQLLVHHIIPERFFKNNKDADSEENLITICRKRQPNSPDRKAPP